PESSSAAPRRAWFEVMLRNPELADYGYVYNCILPFDTGAIPPEDLPLYLRMAREGATPARYYACEALLLYTDRTDVVPDVIDLIEWEALRVPKKPSDRDARAIRLLQRRFGVNFFWDVAAWRRWWADHRIKAGDQSR